MARSVSEPNAQPGVREPEPRGATLSGGQLVAKAVKAEGVDVIFTLCGGNPEAYAPGTMNQTMYK